MNSRIYLALFVLGISAALLVAAFEASPGYMDAEYYFATSLCIANGDGFTEPFLWNFLDNPQGLPHPSHAYWMPLTSLVATLDSRVLGSATFWAARSGFVFLAGFIPLIAGLLAFHFTQKEFLATLAGIMATCSAFYAPYLPTTDTFVLYMLLGGGFFIAYLKNRNHWLLAITLGAIAGLMHLARADGLLWLLMAFVMVGVHWFKSTRGDDSSWRMYWPVIIFLGYVLLGYFVIFGPWMLRNKFVFGLWLSPGGTRALWFTEYDQLFAYPADSITFQNWWASGLIEIFRVRLWALGQNLQTALAVQGNIIMAPLIFFGGWHLRRDSLVQLGGLVWILTLVIMTVAFPFAGARGGFFHSGAALQPLFWALASVGFGKAISWGVRTRGWIERRANLMFATMLVVIMVALSVFVVGGRVLGWGPDNQPWDASQDAYKKLEEQLFAQGASPLDIVLVNNPPGYYLASGRSAIVIPNGDEQTLLAAAQRYKARYLILEYNHPRGLDELYASPNGFPNLLLLWSDDNSHIFQIEDIP